MTELPSPSLMTVVTCNDDDDNVRHNYDDGDQTDIISKRLMTTLLLSKSMSGATCIMMIIKSSCYQLHNDNLMCCPLRRSGRSFSDKFSRNSVSAARLARAGCTYDDDHDDDHDDNYDHYYYHCYHYGDYDNDLLSHECQPCVDQFLVSFFCCGTFLGDYHDDTRDYVGRCVAGILSQNCSFSNINRISLSYLY